MAVQIWPDSRGRPKKTGDRPGAEPDGGHGVCRVFIFKGRPGSSPLRSRSRTTADMSTSSYKGVPRRSRQDACVAMKTQLVFAALCMLSGAQALDR